MPHKCCLIGLKNKGVIICTKQDILVNVTPCTSIRIIGVLVCLSPEKWVLCFSICRCYFEGWIYMSFILPHLDCDRINCTTSKWHFLIFCLLLLNVCYLCNGTFFFWQKTFIKMYNCVSYSITFKGVMTCFLTFFLLPYFLIFEVHLQCFKYKRYYHIPFVRKRVVLVQRLQEVDNSLWQ